MKVAIFGGGVTGLTTAWNLLKKGYEVVIIEGEESVGGLAGGFKEGNWDWALERTYHHVFANDKEIITLAQEMGFDGFRFKRPKTASLMKGKDNYRIFPVDSPIDFLLLPQLSLFSKLRAGATLAFLKISPYLSLFEKTTSEKFIRKTMGEEVWKNLWEQLFRKKFGKYAEYILASFIWARIKKRTPVLGYPNRGFQYFCTFFSEKLKEKGCVIETETKVVEVEKQGEGFSILVSKKTGEQTKINADKIVSTLPFPITLRIGKKILPEEYISQQSKREYLWAINLILGGTEKILKDTYWLNVGAKEVPIMGIIQHTNFVSFSHYGGEELCYCAWYVEDSSDLLKKSGEEMATFVFPYLQKINPSLKKAPRVVRLFKAPFAQPICDEGFLAIDRGFKTPIKNFFVANLDMTYPYDRGTNYAVKLGNDVSQMV